jgi:tRNA G10  N-methylase Trm11
MTRSHKKTIYEVLGRHSVHPFPARMAPGIALDFVSEFGKPIRVLDPMMGSGTVIALAREFGHRATGIDIDPLAVLISRVWVISVDCQVIQRRASRVLSLASRTFERLGVKGAYPHNADHETRRFVRYWFDQRARRQLAALATAIRGTRDGATRDVLWCAFSRLIITKQAGASLARDLAHSRPHKSYKIAPLEPFDGFLNAVGRVLENCICSSRKDRGPAPIIRKGDARRLSVQSSSVDLVLTSPPYINAIDYMRCSKFSLVWMGYSIEELRNVRGTSIGSEVGEYSPGALSAKILKTMRLEGRLSPRHRAILTRFVEDMFAALLEVARVLVPGGKAIYVLGDNTVRGAYIPNSRIITALATVAGLRLEKRHTRVLPPNRRYLPPPSREKDAGLDTRLSREVVLSFRKPNV